MKCGVAMVVLWGVRGSMQTLAGGTGSNSLGVQTESACQVRCSVLLLSIEARDMCFNLLAPAKVRFHVAAPPESVKLFSAS